MVSRTLIECSDNMTDVRTVKLVRLRMGVFAGGTAVGERPQPSRVVHVVAMSADLDAPEGVIAYCGAHFAPRTLVEVPWMTMEPHELCRQHSPFPIPAGMNQPRVSSGEKTRAIMDRAHDGDSLFRDSRVSIRVTAQWSVNNPIIYVNHTAGNECVDLAISGPGENDVIAHFQLNSPLEVLKAGHNLVSAGLSLAESLGADIDQLKAATPSSWWIRGQGQSDTKVTDEELPDS